MLKVEHGETYGWESAIRGMRNPMNSWDKSDSIFVEEGDYHTINGDCGPTNVSVSDTNNYFEVGEKDLVLMKALRNGGSDDRKFMRQIFVSCDITAPLYWWKEMDQYKVGTVTNSCSTMHKIAAKKFERSDFSYEHLFDCMSGDVEMLPIEILDYTIDCLNMCRDLYIAETDPDMKKEYWWQMIQLLPSSYNQKRTWTANYEVLANIYRARKNHKLDCWHTFCDWIRTLPHSELITGEY